jgi:serine phosphatase RsbU (regulator of sigma subunit)
LKVLSSCAGASAADIVSRVMGDVRAFAAGAKQSDDIAVLAARYAPAS